jgi:hypothetical protein
MQTILDLVERDVAVELQAEVDRVHVLGVHLQRRRVQVQVVAERLEQPVRVAGVVGSEALVLVRSTVGDGTNPSSWD